MCLLSSTSRREENLQRHSYLGLDSGVQLKSPTVCFCTVWHQGTQRLCFEAGERIPACVTGWAGPGSTEDLSALLSESLLCRKELRQDNICQVVRQPNVDEREICRAAAHAEA